VLFNPLKHSIKQTVPRLDRFFSVSPTPAKLDALLAFLTPQMHQAADSVCQQEHLRNLLSTITFNSGRPHLKLAEDYLVCQQAQLDAAEDAGNVLEAAVRDSLKAL
jgi:hypothetical protein